MAKYLAQRTIRHGFKEKIKDYEANAVMELSEEDAAPLLDCGAVVAVAEAESGKKKKTDD